MYQRKFKCTGLRTLLLECTKEFGTVRGRVLSQDSKVLLFLPNPRQSKEVSEEVSN